MGSLASLRRRYILFMYKVYRILQKEFSFSQKEVDFIYVYFVNKIPQKDFGIPFIYYYYYVITC